MCWGHYQRWYRYGSPLAGAPRQTFHERLFSRFDQPEVGCWLCPKGSSARVQMPDGRRLGLAVAVYETMVGPLPKGTRLRSVCKVADCVRPEHHGLGQYRKRAA